MTTGAGFGAGATTTGGTMTGVGAGSSQHDIKMEMNSPSSSSSCFIRRNRSSSSISCRCQSAEASGSVKMMLRTSARSLPSSIAATSVVPVFDAMYAAILGSVVTVFFTMAMTAASSKPPLRATRLLTVGSAAIAVVTMALSSAGVGKKILRASGALRAAATCLTASALTSGATSSGTSSFLTRFPSPQAVARVRAAITTIEIASTVQRFRISISPWGFTPFEYLSVNQNAFIPFNT